MDPFTHILFGNACALAATRRPGRITGDLARRIPVATAAALFPDLDYLNLLADDREPGWLQRLGLPVERYRALDALQWNEFRRFGGDGEHRAIVEQAWSQPQFDPSPWPSPGGRGEVFFE